MKIDRLRVDLYGPVTREQLASIRQRLIDDGESGIVDVRVCCKVCGQNMTGWTLLAQRAERQSHGLIDRLRRAWIRQFGSKRLAERRNLT